MISSVLAPEIYCANQILLISKPQIIIKMKKYIPKLLAIFTLILLTSCSSDDEHDHGVTADQIPAIQAALISGDWIISHYSTKFGSDQTATYSAYSFSFLNVMIFNLYSVFVLFIIHFNLGLRKGKRQVG